MVRPERRGTWVEVLPDLEAAGAACCLAVGPLAPEALELLELDSWGAGPLLGLDTGVSTGVGVGRD